MQTRPDQWTHHHTHRMFHLSLLICHVFMVVVIIAGSLYSLFDAYAADISIDENLNITADVPDLTITTPTPTTPTTTIPPLPSTSQPYPTPTLGYPSLLLYMNGSDCTNRVEFGDFLEKQLICDTKNPTPLIIGQSSFAHGKVALILEGPTAQNFTLILDPNGDFIWKPIKPLIIGLYKLSANILNENSTQVIESTSLWFLVSEKEKLSPPSIPSPKPNPTIPTRPPFIAKPPTAPQKPPQTPPEVKIPEAYKDFILVFLKIPPSKKKIYKGETIHLPIEVRSLSGKSGPRQIRIRISVYPPRTKTPIVMESEVRFVENGLFTAEIKMNAASRLGQYTVFVSLPSENTEWGTTDSFEVIESPLIIGSTQNLSFIEKIKENLVQILLWMIIALFILLMIIWHHQHVKHHSLQIINRNPLKRINPSLSP